jgi:hypothetical protein
MALLKPKGVDVVFRLDTAVVVIDGTRGSEVQILSPRPFIFNSLRQARLNHLVLAQVLWQETPRKCWLPANCWLLSHLRNARLASIEHRRTHAILPTFMRTTLPDLNLLFRSVDSQDSKRWKFPVITQRVQIGVVLGPLFTPAGAHDPSQPYPLRPKLARGSRAPRKWVSLAAPFSFLRIGRESIPSRPLRLSNAAISK